MSGDMPVKNGKWCALFVAIAIAGCATVFEGTDQQILVNVTPENANCSVNRKDIKIASLSGGTNTVTIDKSRNAIFLECTAPGYQTATLKVDSSATGWGVAGCFLFDLCITDYSTGALNDYPESISISLKPGTGVADGSGAANQTAMPGPTSMGSTKANPSKPASPVRNPGPWYTLHNDVRLHLEPRDSSASVAMPNHVPLTLLTKTGDWGRFQYRAADGSQADGWIVVANIRGNP